jgi:hypothetical protein
MRMSLLQFPICMRTTVQFTNTKLCHGAWSVCVFTQIRKKRHKVYIYKKKKLKKKLVTYKITNKKQINTMPTINKQIGY